MRKNNFLYSQEYRDLKIGAKKRAEQFFQKLNEKCGQKMLGKNRRKKLRKKVFYIHTNIVSKKWGKKRSKQFFQKHTNRAS